jgi:hypothetical protein
VGKGKGVFCNTPFYATRKIGFMQPDYFSVAFSRRDFIFLLRLF